MTREEAVEHLNTIGQYYSQDHSDPYDECERLTKDELDAIYLAIKALEQEPCYNPDEWCHDCKEYNQDKHCCPRFNKVIRNTVEEIKEPKMGYWISYWDEDAGCYVYKCPECGNKQPFDTKHCWECGTRLIVSQESENKE